MAHKHMVDPSSPRTATGTVTLTASEVLTYTVFSIDPGGAGRNVDLPAASSTYAGVELRIANTADAAEVLTIRDGGSATVCTPTQNEDAVLWCDGTTWRGGTVAHS